MSPSLENQGRVKFSRGAVSLQPARAPPPQVTRPVREVKGPPSFGRLLPLCPRGTYSSGRCFLTDARPLRFDRRVKAAALLLPPEAALASGSKASLGEKC